MSGIVCMAIFRRGRVVANVRFSPVKIFAFLFLLVGTACGSMSLPSTPPVAIVGLIEFWQPVNGALAPGEKHGWKFLGAAGDRVRLRSITTADDVLLALQNPDEIELASGETIEAELPLDGTYTVFIESASGGQYELGLGYADRPNPADYTPTPLPVTVTVPTPTPPFDTQLGEFISPIVGGQTLAGAFFAPDDSHIYSFEAGGGEYLTVMMTRESGGLDPVLRLYDPDGAELASDDNNGGGRTALLGSIYLAQPGLYSIIGSGDGFSGGYKITLVVNDTPIPVVPTFIFVPTATRQPDILAPTLGAAVGDMLDDHAPVIAQVNRPGDFNRFIIEVQAGDVFTVGARPATGSTLRPRLEVYDPDGALVASAGVNDSGAGGDALVAALRAGMGGAYAIFVTGDEDTTGAYTLSYGERFSRLEVRRGETLPDQAYAGAVERRGLRDAWSLYLNAGDVITAAASPDDAIFDPLLELAGPDGTVIASDNNSGGERDALIAAATAPVSGLYRLRVVAAGGFGSGPYTLIWRYINRAPDPTQPPGTAAIMTFDDALEEGEYGFYTFQGKAGQMVRVHVIASAETFDPVAALLGVDGEIIAEGDDEDGLNPRFEARLPQDGTYTVRVSGYLSSGQFMLTVEGLYPAPPS